jgi:serine/threonine-protein kinase HipA
MYTLAVFNIFAHNRDDHLRQFTYLMSREGEWKLAPAYDLTFSSGPGGEHSTSLLGLGKHITRTELLALGRSADLDDAESEQIIERVASAVADWDHFAQEWDVSQASRTQIGVALALVRKSATQNG